MTTQEEQQLTGVVHAIVYHSRESGFTVLELEAGDELVTVVGEALDLSEGEEIVAHGSYTSHPSYGRQFRASSFERVLPATASAILRYLAGGAVKGIGPVLAKRIVDKFGDETLTMLEQDPQALSGVRGISPTKARELGEEYRRILGVRSVMLFLGAHGIGPSTAIAVWKKWGGLAPQMISADPYCLCGGDIGLPFEQADAIAASLGLETAAPCRVKGGVRYVLSHNLGNGHTCLPESKLIETTCALLDVGREQVEEAVATLRGEGGLLGEALEGADYLYLPEQYAAEEYIAGRLHTMLAFAGQDKPVGEDELTALEQELGIAYARRQREALCAAVAQPIFILTGGPGTGKTTTLNGIITLFERRGMEVALAAPTGRAAKRLSEVTGREAKTIHRLLEVDFGSEVSDPRFKRNERNPLPVDAVVVDEMSMVDARLFESLLKACRLACRLVLVGDPDQLPSVGAGNVLRDLIGSEVIACVHLDEVFRQAAQSLIVLSAHEIVSGELPELGRNDADFFFLPRSSQEQTAATVTDLCARRLPKAYNLAALRDIQVIAPGKQGGCGTIELNRRLQEALNPPAANKSEYKTALGGLLREGDKVMQVRNNYDLVWQRPDGEEGLGVFNGDIGIVEMIDKPTRSVEVSFEDRRALYSFDMLSELDLAYAITIHKSQGNEFEAVVIPLFGQHRRLHYRNLLYTAVTRARRLLVMVGQKETVAAMVQNDRKTLRYTNLAARLRQPL